MKKKAELASAASGGATYLAQRLRELSDNAALRGKRPLELHAIGHSAGSIFHSWFVPMAAEAGIPAFRTLQLLAPAISVPDFTARLAQHIGPGRAAASAVGDRGRGPAAHPGTSAQPTTSSRDPRTCALVAGPVARTCVSGA